MVVLLQFELVDLFIRHCLSLRAVVSVPTEMDSSHHRRQAPMIESSDSDADPLALLSRKRALTSAASSSTDGQRMTRSTGVTELKHNTVAPPAVRSTEFNVVITTRKKARWSALMGGSARSQHSCVSAIRGLLHTACPRLSALVDSAELIAGDTDTETVLGFAVMQCHFDEPSNLTELDGFLGQLLAGAFSRTTHSSRCTVRHEVVRSALLDQPFAWKAGDNENARDIWSRCKDYSFDMPAHTVEPPLLYNAWEQTIDT